MITLHDGERVITKIRKHWFVFFLESFGLLVAAILPIGLLWLPFDLLSEMLPGLGNGQIGALITFVAAVWEMVLFTTFMVLLTTYYLDVIVVTNKRIMDMEQVSLFSRDIASLPIENIEDVKVKTTGIIAEIFKFGSLDIQTAGEIKEVEVRGVRHPERARDIIMEAYHINKHTPQ